MSDLRALPPSCLRGTESFVRRDLISRTPRLLATVALVALVEAGAVGCSGSGSPGATGSTGASQSGADSGGTVGCAGQGDTYTANLTKKGANGYSFTLVQASPAPPAQYANVWTLKVVDASGAIPGASQIALEPYMPLMGHGSDQVPTISANPDGSFTVNDVYLFMQGLWQVTVKVSSASPSDGGAALLDSAVYKFCID